MAPPSFSTNRLGGRVGQTLSAPVDVAVSFVERGGERLERLLVPYAANIHDELAQNLLSDCLLVVIPAVSLFCESKANQVQSDLSYEFSNLMQQLPADVRDRIDIQIIEAAEPIAVVEASAAVDLTIAGTSRGESSVKRWGDTQINYKDSVPIFSSYPPLSSHFTSPQCLKRSSHISQKNDA